MLIRYPAQAMRRITRKAILIATLAVASSAGFGVQGWPGLFLWPLALCVSVLLLAIGWFVIDLFVSYSRLSEEVGRIWARVHRLSNDELRDLIANPSHKDSGFARAELMQRGENARPTKEQLFGMLTSGNNMLCGQAMTYVHIFYPELRELVPTGSSNLDPPEVWQARVAAVKSTG